MHSICKLLHLKLHLPNTTLQCVTNHLLNVRVCLYELNKLNSSRKTITICTSHSSEQKEKDTKAQNIIIVLFLFI